MTIDASLTAPRRRRRRRPTRAWRPRRATRANGGDAGIDAATDPQAPAALGRFGLATGAEKTVDVALYSDGPTAAWTVSAVDGNELANGTADLAFQFDRTTGQNGDTLHMTVHRLQATASGSTLVLVTSKLGAHTNTWTGYIGNE